MKKPILFIHETPFFRDISEQMEAYNRLRTRLEQFGGIELIEFAWGDYPKDWEMPEKDSAEFCEWVSGRKMVFVHNSFPDSKDPDPLFEDAYIPRLRELAKPGVLIRFSGNAREINVVGDDLRFYRKDIYNHLDIFIRHWKTNGLQAPFFHLIKDGQAAFLNQAKDLKLEIRLQLFERNSNLAAVLAGSKEYIPKAEWRSKIGGILLQELLWLTGKSQDWIDAALIKLDLKKPKYLEPEQYLADLDGIIRTIEKRMPV